MRERNWGNVVNGHGVQNFGLYTYPIKRSAGFTSNRALTDIHVAVTLI